MKTNKLKDFTKKYGFYLAVGVVSIGAVTAVFLTSDRKSNVVSEKDPYEQSQEVAGGDVLVTGEEAMLDPVIITDDLAETGPTSSNEEIIATDGSLEDEVESAEADVVGEVTDEASELAAETFSSTTADPNELPYFAEGDTLLWPVEGEVIVPFRDDSTKHWYSTALEQTMRTYGICISAKEGEHIKSPAKGTIIDIVEDSTTLDSTKLVGNVGQVIILDLGNGYKAEIGLQGGKANKDLLGQVVDATQVIGEAGNGTGPFADLSYNVYMQVKHNDVAIDPTTMLGFHESIAGVDMGHVAE